jgi:hypothetical protein
MRTREEHLEWCKQQARHYLKQGRAADAIASMMSDLGKHPDFKGIEEKMALLGLFYAAQGNIDDARRFVEGFR